MLFFFVLRGAYVVLRGRIKWCDASLDSRFRGNDKGGAGRAGMAGKKYKEQSAKDEMDSRLRGNDKGDGNDRREVRRTKWIPACAGMTGNRIMKGMLWLRVKRF